ncbi:hypothetical protein WMY93_020574 [Mugilogobius chulae]|uniref:VWFC domain-containing protein n=1 Tax=Mugilogobius chulae TaxID=88201 RepID=A0AAW0NIB6_9GOBI
MLPKADSCSLVLFSLFFVQALTDPPRTEQRCPGQFACRSGKLQCIPLTWQCDGWTACEDKSDEMDCPQKCPTGWHHYEKTASCYKVYLRNENYWQAVDTCQKVNGSLATFVTNEELQFILKIEVDFDEKVCERKDQCKFWVGYQYVITNQNHSLQGRWEVAYKGAMQVFLPPEGLASIGDASPPRTMYNVVNEGYYFTPKGDDPCLSCTCHDGEPEMCVAALCERPQGCQHFRKDPKECCKFTCLDPDGNSLFDSMASGMRLIVSCISSFLILSLLLFMVHRLRQRRRERIETLIGGNLHHFNLGRRVPGFDYGPDWAFHFQEPPPPYAAYKYPDIPHPDDPPPPYEASINPDSLLYVDLGHTGVAMVPGQMNALGDGLQPDLPNRAEREDSIDSSTLLVGPDTPTDGPMSPSPVSPDSSLSTARHRSEQKTSTGRIFTPNALHVLRPGLQIQMLCCKYRSQVCTGPVCSPVTTTIMLQVLLLLRQTQL